MDDSKATAGKLHRTTQRRNFLPKARGTGGPSREAVHASAVEILTADVMVKYIKGSKGNLSSLSKGYAS